MKTTFHQLLALFSFTTKKGSYSRGVLDIFFSKLGITLFTFISTPFIARLYNPEDYGYYALINTVVINAILLSNLTYPLSLVVVKKKHLLSVIWLICFATIFVSIATPFITLLLSHVILDLKRVNSFETILGVLPGLVFFGSMASVFANLNIREKQFQQNIKTNITEIVLSKSFSLFFGFVGFTQIGLIISEGVGKVANVIVQLIFLLKGKKSFDHLKFDFDAIREAAVQNKNYPLYQMPITFLNRFFIQAFIWVLAIYFSTENLGYFSMSTSLLFIPVNIIANSLQPVIMRKMKDIREEGSNNLIIRLLVAATVLAVVIYLGVFLLSPFFIRAYLGPQWVNAVPFIRLLCLGFAGVMMGNIFSGAYMVYQLQHIMLKVKLLMLFIMVLAMALAIKMTVTLVTLVAIFSIFVFLEEAVKISIFFNLIRNAERTRIL